MVVMGQSNPQRKPPQDAFRAEAEDLGLTKVYGYFARATKSMTQRQECSSTMEQYINAPSISTTPCNRGETNVMKVRNILRMNNFQQRKQRLATLMARQLIAS